MQAGVDKTSLYIISSKQIYMKYIVSYYRARKHIDQQDKYIFLLSHTYTITSKQPFVRTRK